MHSEDERMGLEQHKGEEMVTDFSFLDELIPSEGRQELLFPGLNVVLFLHNSLCFLEGNEEIQVFYLFSFVRLLLPEHFWKH